MTARFLDAFRGRSVLVTGHTGFKGSWLCIWLDRLGARVTGYSLPPPTEPSNFIASDVRRLVARHEEADIRDAVRLGEVMARTRPEVVFHLAAQSLVRPSYAEPRRTLEVNVIGTAAVLDAVRACRQPCAVVVVTSDKCYENQEQGWAYREGDPLGGHDLYSASKGAAEIVAGAYRRSFFPPDRVSEHGVKLATARAGNVIGGGDWAKDRLLPDVVRSLALGEAVALRSPRAVRPWQHVLEPLGGYLLLAARLLESDDPTWCEAWNFGPMPGQEVAVAGLVDLFLAAWEAGEKGTVPICRNGPEDASHKWGLSPFPAGEGVGWRAASEPGQPHEAGVLHLNIDKALCRLGWCPVWGPAEAVARAARWYRQFYSGPSRSMLDACRDDIDAYEQACAATATAERIP
ncbi:MAG: CDP-glucose 4,6-dehydratase [Thermoguttaceae bacterium]|jgi:CDP-glucose 4,6-dehydratase